MNDGSMVSLVALFAWLILAVSAFRAHRIGKRKLIVMVLTWGAIFAAVALFFSFIGQGG